MAFLSSNFNKDEEDDKKTPVNQDGGGSSGSKTLAAPGAMGGDGTSQNTSKKGTSSGSFTNLNNYVKANEGNDAKMGEDIRQGVENTANETKGKIDSFSSDITTQAKTNTVNDSGVVDALRKDPNAVDADAFSKQVNATYQGPVDYTTSADFQDALAGTQKVSQSVANAQGGMAGREQLLDQQYKRSDYGKGQKLLDSFILGAGQQGQEKINQIGQYADFGSGFDTAKANAQAAIDAAKSTTEQTAKDTRTAFEKAMGSSWDALDAAGTTAATKNATAKERYDLVVGQLGSDKAGERLKAYKNLGMDQKTGDWLYNKYASQLGAEGAAKKMAELVTQRGDFSRGDFVSDEQEAQYKNLSNLLGMVNDKTGMDKYMQSFTGLEDTGIDVNSQGFSAQEDRIKGAADLMGLNQQIQSQVNAMRDEQNALKAMFGGQGLDPYGAYRKLGFNEKEANILSSALKAQGKNLNDFITYNDYGSRGDAATAEQASKYIQLASMLGLDSGTWNKSKADSPYTANTDALKKILEVERAKAQQALSGTVMDGKAKPTQAAIVNSGAQQPTKTVPMPADNPDDPLGGLFA